MGNMIPLPKISAPNRRYRYSISSIRTTGDREAFRSTSSGLLYAAAGSFSDKIDLTIHVAKIAGPLVNIASTFVSAKEKAEPDIDAQIAAMSSEELAGEIRALAGAWADRDDVGDHWLDELREDISTGWAKRIEELYGDEDLSL